MTDEEYKETKPYKTGLFYYEYGKLLIDKNSTIDDIVKLARKNGLTIDLSFCLDEPKTEAIEKP